MENEFHWLEVWTASWVAVMTAVQIYVLVFLFHIHKTLKKMVERDDLDGCGSLD